jgi:ATP-dependent Lon protease
MCEYVTMAKLSLSLNCYPLSIEYLQVILADLIPLFPLPLVLFPGTAVPLHIFEERYKIMIRDVMDGDETFGIVRVEDSSGRLAKIGCLAKLTSIERLADGRMNIFTEGMQKFSIIELVHERAYAQARVQMIDEPAPNAKAQAQAKKLRTVLDDVIRLSEKLAGELIPSDKVPSDPAGLSYWIADSFYSSTAEQQRLLDMVTVNERLECERIRLDAACKQLAARTALKDVFS